MSALPSEVEVLVVGAGAAGSVYAARLAQAGRNVLVLDSGPAWEASDLLSSQIWGRRLKWSGPLLQQPPGPPAFSHSHATGRGFGGAALHHFGTWLRLRPSDFGLRTLHGVGVDWPIGYDELRPFYDRVQDEMGIAGDARRESGRPPGKAYPMPAHPLFKQARLLAKGFEAIGLRVSALPLAINSRPFKGRLACLYDGWCEAGCPIGALANPLVTHIRVARAAGARFVADTTVTRVLCDERGRARAVECFDASGVRHEVSASLVVLAASVVQNPRLLLNSADARHPQGLANRSGQVGNGLMVDAVAPVFGLFDVATENHRGVNAGQLLYRGDHVDSKRPQAPGAYQWQIAPSLKPNDLLGIATTRADLYGSELHRFMHQAARSMASAAGFASALPDPGNRIVVGSGKAADGMPAAQLIYRHSPQTLRLREHLVSEGTRAFEASGARQVWAGPLAGGHLVGGTAMGADPTLSVCDSYGRCHDVPNLILAGSGIFPGGSGSSPTFTIYALAERSAAYAVKHWRDLRA